jgi:hypothetical protein
MSEGPPNPDPDRRRAVVVASQTSQTELRTALDRLGYDTTCFDDPYSAYAFALSHAVGLRAFVVSLQSLYREELAVLASVGDRLPHLDRVVTHVQARQVSLAEAIRHGATTLLDDQGLHPLDGAEPARPPVVAPAAAAEPARTGSRDPEPGDFDPLLSAEELRALLHDPT